MGATGSQLAVCAHPGKSQPQLQDKHAGNGDIGDISRLGQMPDRAPRPPSGDPIPAPNMNTGKSWPLKPNMALSRSDQSKGPKSNDCQERRLGHDAARWADDNRI